MEERFDDDFYTDILTQRLYFIVFIMSLIANVVGTVANYIIFGMSLTTIVCLSCTVIILLAALIAKLTGKYNVIVYIVTAVIIGIEFPALYMSYRLSAISYLLLGLYASCVLYRGRVKIGMLIAMSIIYSTTIVLSFFFTDIYEEVIKTADEYAMISSGIVSSLISIIAILLTLNLILYNYKTKNNEYIELNKRIERMNHYDALTPCYNRKFLMDYLKMNCNVRAGTGLTICLFDLVDLGYINFKYGYSTGDQVLSDFADIIFNSLKSRGIVARYDGQKFVAVIYATALEEIRRIVNVIADNFKKYCEKLKSEKFYFAYGITICKSSFSVDDELRIVYARSCDYASKLPKRNWTENDVKNINLDVSEE